MPELQKYSGSCHCGNVRIEVETDLKTVVACNCSMCSRAGTLLTFVAPEQFRLLAGEGAQGDYQFNKKNVHHLFCSTCGIKSFAHGTGPGGEPMYAVNVRCLEGVEPATLSIQQVDGKSL